jgi:hypothetical protein
VDRDLLTALVLLFIGGVALFSAGDDVKNWMFPLLATYLIIAIAVALIARVVFAAIMKHVPDIVHLARENRTAFFDVLVFFLIVLTYIFVMSGLGFWLSSLLMLSLTSIYLTLDKTRRNIRIAMVVPLVTCVAAYFVFLRVFYVPFPKATWWPGLS